jgi:acetyl esterase/lipase
MSSNGILEKETLGESNSTQHNSNGTKPTIEIDHRTNRSIPTFILHNLIKPFRAKLTSFGNPLPAGSQQLKPYSKARRKCDIQEREVEDIYIYDLISKKIQPQFFTANAKKRRKRIYYFAGGGWQAPPSADHWVLCTAIATETSNTRVSVVSYPLAPNSPAPDAFPQLMKMYRRIMQEAAEAGQEVILAGDSAGGNVVLCLTLAALAESEDLPSPKALMVLSPSCDLRRQNPDMKEVARHDPILRYDFVLDTANKWRGSWDAADPRVTPLLADISLLAKRDVQVHGIVGGYDILGPDCKLFRDKCQKNGVRGKWLDWDKQMHVFPLAYPYLLPESVAAKKWLIEDLKKI